LYAAVNAKQALLPVETYDSIGVSDFWLETVEQIVLLFRVETIGKLQQICVSSFDIAFAKLVCILFFVVVLVNKVSLIASLFDTGWMNVENIN